jgi:uncharacterized membrane protein (DUF2068 family)
MITAKAHSGLRAIALFKASKSLLALLGAVWLFSMTGHDVHATALAAVRHLHLNADSGFVHYLLGKTAAIRPANIWMVIWTLTAYSLVHGAEAYGLWREYTWAEWFTLLSGAIYIPLELHSMTHGLTRVNIGAFILSLIITGYVGGVLYQTRKRRRLAALMNADRI